MIENLRQHCIYNLAPTDKAFDGEFHSLTHKKNKDIYFEYVARAHQVCRSRITKTCSKNIAEGLKLNFAELEKCVEGTFEGDSMSLDDNSVLKDHANEWQKLGTHLSPAMVINNRTFRGRLTPDNVFEAICASFNHEPKQCRKWQEMEGIPIPRGQSTGITQRTLFSLILILISVNVIIILCYRRYLNNEM